MIIYKNQIYVLSQGDLYIYEDEKYNRIPLEVKVEEIYTDMDSLYVIDEKGTLYMDGYEKPGSGEYLPGASGLYYAAMESFLELNKSVGFRALNFGAPVTFPCVLTMDNEMYTYEETLVTMDLPEHEVPKELKVNCVMSESGRIYQIREPSEKSENFRQTLELVYDKGDVRDFFVYNDCFVLTNQGNVLYIPAEGGGRNELLEKEISKWKNMISVTADHWFVFGLGQDGRVTVASHGDVLQELSEEVRQQLDEIDDAIMIYLHYDRTLLVLHKDNKITRICL